MKYLVSCELIGGGHGVICVQDDAAELLDAITRSISFSKDKKVTVQYVEFDY